MVAQVSQLESERADTSRCGLGGNSAATQVTLQELQKQVRL